MKLTETQIRKLQQSEMRLRAARGEVAREEAIQQDIIEMVLDAHGAPKDARINLETGAIEVPPAEDITPDGVSEAAKVEPVATAKDAE